MNCHIHPRTGLLYDVNWLLYCPSCDDTKVIENQGGEVVRTYTIRNHYPVGPRDLYETEDFFDVDDFPVHTIIKRRISPTEASILTAYS